MLLQTIALAALSACDPNRTDQCGDYAGCYDVTPVPAQTFAINVAVNETTKAPELPKKYMCACHVYATVHLNHTSGDVTCEYVPVSLSAVYAAMFFLGWCGIDCFIFDRGGGGNICYGVFFLLFTPIFPLSLPIWIIRLIFLCATSVYRDGHGELAR